MAALRKYIWGVTKEQLVSVLPVVGLLFLCIYLVSFASGTEFKIKEIGDILVAVAFTIIGLMFFMEGLKFGLISLGENVGSTLPLKMKLLGISIFSVLVGYLATLAEPAISALQTASAGAFGDLQKLAGEGPAGQALALMVKEDALLPATKLASQAIVNSVGVGVGLAVALGVFRILINKPVIYFIIPCQLVLITLTFWAESLDSTTGLLSLAWDTGGVTTGPVTVPLVLALGIGISAVMTTTSSGMSGFGIIMLASYFPIIGVLSLGIISHYMNVDFTTEVAAQVSVIMEAGREAVDEKLVGGVVTGWDWFMVNVWSPALQPILMLCSFLFIYQIVILKSKIQELPKVTMGVGFCIIGLFFFTMGIADGILPLAQQTGRDLGEFISAEDFSGTALFWTILVSLFLGYGATIAEPALNALGIQVEELTQGSMKKAYLLQFVAVGVAVGMTLGIVSLFFKARLIYWLLPFLGVLMFITFFSKDKYNCIGYDAAGVTTGPVTVPIVIALGLGITTQFPVEEGVRIFGFGIISMASIGPIIAVLLLGIKISRGAPAISPIELTILEMEKSEEEEKLRRLLSGRTRGGSARSTLRTSKRR